MQQVLNSVLDISSRKSSEGEAIENMLTILNSMKSQFSFLQNIQIQDTRFMEGDRSVLVGGDDIDDIETSQVGAALEQIIWNMHRNLGKKAGYFFMKELKQTLGDDFFYAMKDLGVDLSIMQLQNEVLK